MRATFNPEADAQGHARLWVSRDYLAHVEIISILPEPEASQVSEDRITWLFSVAEAGRPVTVDIHLRPEQAGRVHGRLGLPDGAEVSFTQLIYP